MVNAVDVSGRFLQVGDEVAFCLGGRGTEMRVGEVTKITAKSVIIETMQLVYCYTEKQHVFRGVNTTRAHGAVSKVFRAEEIVNVAG